LTHWARDTVPATGVGDALSSVPHAERAPALSSGLEGLSRVRRGVGREARGGG
ncbi:hypothetical protein IscW_ISCW000485, partial [Ixodes scapularis]